MGKAILKPNKATAWTVGAVLLLCLAVGVWVPFSSGVSASLKNLLNGLTLGIPMLIGAWAAWSVPTSDGPFSRIWGWRIFGAGMAACGASDFFHMAMVVRLGDEDRASTLSNPAFLLAYVLQGLGIWLLVSSMSRRSAVVRVDGFIAALGIPIIAWKVGLEAHLANGLPTNTTQWLEYMMPIGSVMQAWAAFALFSTALVIGKLYRQSFALATGILVVAFADLTWIRLMHANAYIGPSVVDAGWIVGYVIQACGVLSMLVAMNQKQRANAPSPGNSLLTDYARAQIGKRLPMLVGLGSCLYLVSDKLISGDQVPVEFWGVTGVMAVVLIFRHIFSLTEEQQEIRKIAETLEQKVHDRTKQLEARYLLAKSVSSTPEADEFAAAAIRHVDQIFEADGLLLSIRHGILPEHPRGLTETVRLGSEVLNLLGDMINLNDPRVSVDPHRVLVGEDWQIATILRVPLRAMNEVYGNLFAIRLNENFSNDDRNTMESIALEIASALGHNILYNRAVEASEKDYLTNAMNHRAISRRLQLLIDGEDGHKAAGVMLVDVGGFKLFNDTYGHSAGDDMLRCIAGRLQELVTPLGGYIGRTGGDEFMVVMPDYSISDTYRLAARFQQVVHQIEFKIAGYGENIPLEVNIGVAAYPESGENPYTILAFADGNLIEAKQNRVTFFRAEPQQAPTESSGPSQAMSAVEMMLTAIDNVDSYTRRHSLDVKKYAVWLAEELGCSVGTVEEVGMAAMLHDVGKIAVPATILRKPGSLTDEEFDLMKQHTTIGAMIVTAMPDMQDLVPGVRSHHERYDGRGYPDGLAGDEIPFLGRLLAVADAFSAMTTDRPYRKGMSWPVAAKRIQQGIGTQFDPRMAEAFLRVLEARGVRLDEAAGEDTHRRAA